jgi:hypothetical protein
MNFFLRTFDRDAASAIDAGSITGDANRRAADFLCYGLKRIQLWDRCSVVGGLLGGNATANSINYKNPSVPFISNGTVSHANGVTSNGTDGYVDLSLNGNTLDSNVFGLIYSPSAFNVTGNNAFRGYFGVTNGTTTTFGVSWYDVNEKIYANAFGPSSIQVARAAAATIGLIGVARNGSNCYCYQNGASIGSVNAASLGNLNGNIWICGVHNTGGASAVAAANIRLVIIGDEGASAQDMANLNALNAQFQLLRA